MDELTIENYRVRVIKTVPCSHCGARINQGCTKPTRFMLRWSSVALPYVHDHRSAAFAAIPSNLKPGRMP